MSDDDTRHSGSRWEPAPDDAAHRGTAGDAAGDRRDVPATEDLATAVPASDGPLPDVPVADAGGGTPTDDTATDPADDTATRQIPVAAWHSAPDSSLLAMPPIPAVASPQPRRTRRRVGLAAAAAAGLLALGGGGGYALGHLGGVSAPTTGPAGAAGPGHHHGRSDAGVGRGARTDDGPGAQAPGAPAPGAPAPGGGAGTTDGAT